MTIMLPRWIKIICMHGIFHWLYADKCPAILTSASLVRNRDGTIIEGLMVGAPNYIVRFLFFQDTALSLVVLFADASER